MPAVFDRLRSLGRRSDSGDERVPDRPMGEKSRRKKELLDYQEKCPFLLPAVPIIERQADGDFGGLLHDYKMLYREWGRLNRLAKKLGVKENKDIDIEHVATHVLPDDLYKACEAMGFCLDGDISWSYTVHDMKDGFGNSSLPTEFFWLRIKFSEKDGLTLFFRPGDEQNDVRAQIHGKRYLDVINPESRMREELDRRSVIEGFNELPLGRRIDQVRELVRKLTDATAFDNEMLGYYIGRE